MVFNTFNHTVEELDEKLVNDNTIHADSRNLFWK